MEQAVIFGKTPMTVEEGKIFAVALGCMAAVFIQADYDYIGIIIIAAFYEFHASRAGRSLSAAVLGGLETLDLNFGVGHWQQYLSGFIMENVEIRDLNTCFTGFIQCI